MSSYATWLLDNTVSESNKIIWDNMNRKLLVSWKTLGKIASEFVTNTEHSHIKTFVPLIALTDRFVFSLLGKCRNMFSLI